MPVRKSPEVITFQEQTVVSRRVLSRPLLKLSPISAEIKKPFILTFRTATRTSIISISKNNADGEGDARYMMRDRRCDRCTYRHPSGVECGHNMLIKPQSFKAKRMFPRGMKLTSSGSD